MRRLQTNGKYTAENVRINKRAGVKILCEPIVIKAVISLILFMLVLIIKNFGGSGVEPVRQALSRYIGSGADYKQAVQAIGRAVADNNIAQAVGEQAVKVFGKSLLIPYEYDEDENDDSAAFAADGDDADGEGIDGGRTYGDDNAEDYKNGDLTDDWTESENNSDFTFKASDFDGQSGYIAADDADRTKNADMTPLKSVQPIVISGAEELEAISALREEVVDTTPATEFAQKLPSVVDAGVYELPFKYAAPIKGTVTSKFGYRKHPITGGYSFHYGVDIGASKGDKIVSFAEGTVIETGKGTVYGNYVKVQHADGYWTRYCHLNKISVKKGQKVKMSQKIGEAGTTGMSTGVHLHFELRRNDKILNPSLYVKF